MGKIPVFRVKLLKNFSHYLHYVHDLHYSHKMVRILEFLQTSWKVDFIYDHMIRIFLSRFSHIESFVVVYIDGLI